MTARPPRVWTAPLCLAAIGAAGLLSALLGDGVWDAVAWFGLGAPLVVAGWFVWGSRARD